jgi:hypothetical protein
MSAPDAIDLHGVTVYNSPQDIADWPITHSILSITMRPTGDPLNGLAFVFDPPLPDAWKWSTGNPKDATDNVQYTVWAISEKNDAAAFVQMWQGRPATGAPILSDFHANWAYSSRWGPLNLYVPEAGDVMGFFVSAGNGRDRNMPTSVRERSNVVLVKLPPGDTGQFVFLEAPAPPEKTPAPTPEPPAPYPPAYPIYVATKADLAAMETRLHDHLDKVQAVLLEALKPILDVLRRFGLL